MVERADVDAIIIGTPTDTHVSLMLHAVKMGKAVLCEKPIDLDIAKVDAAVDEIERLNGRVMVAFNRRFDPSARQLRRSIDAGEIGDVRQVIITSRDPGMPPREYIGHSGGIFRDMVIHDFDMARWLLGEEPTEVMATASRLVDSGLAVLNENLRPTTVRRWGKTETEVREPLLNFFLERYAEAYKTEFDQSVQSKMVRQCLLPHMTAARRFVWLTAL